MEMIGDMCLMSKEELVIDGRQMRKKGQFNQLL